MKKVVYRINGMEITKYTREKEDNNRKFSSCKLIIKDDKKKTNLDKK